MKTNIIILFILLNFGITPILYSQSEEHKELYKSGKEKFKNGDYFNSKEELKKYIDLNITNSNPFVKLKVDKALEYNGIANFYIVDFEEALKSFLSLLNSQSITIKVKSNIHYFLGMINYYDAKYNYAIKEFDQVSDVSDYLNDMLFYRGVCKLRAYGLDNANNDFSSIYGKEYVDYKAFVLYYKGYKDEAKKELEEIAMKDNNASCFIDLAEYYALENNKIDALKNIEVAFKMGFNKPVLLYKETNFQNIIKTNEFNLLLDKYSIKKPAFIIIEQEKLIQDSIRNARIKFQKDSIDAALGINSEIYIYGYNSYIFDLGSSSILSKTYNFDPILFSELINEKLIKDYTLPYLNEKISVNLSNYKQNNLWYSFNVNNLDSVGIFNNEFLKLDQFDRKEKENYYKQQIITFWKKYRFAYENQYLKNNYRYKYRMRRFVVSDTINDYYSELNKNDYNLDENTLTLHNIYTNNKIVRTDEYPLFNYSIGENDNIKIPLNISDAKKMIKGEEQTFYEKIYLVKYNGGIIANGYAGGIFSTNCSIESIIYNFYKGSQWNSELKRFTGKPIFEYEKIYKIKSIEPKSIYTKSEMLSKSWVLSEIRNINDTIAKKIDGRFVIKFNTNNTCQNFVNNVEDTDDRNKRWSLIDENGEPDLDGNYILIKYISDKGNNREFRWEIISITNDELIIKVENIIQILIPLYH